MFGQQNNQQQDNGHIPDHAIDSVISGDGGSGNQPQQDWGHPGAPIDDHVQLGQHDQPIQDVTPQHDDHQDQPHDDAAPDQPTQPAPQNDELIDIKQQALTQLSPLVGHLDQSPEEKFRTTMMMLQASDDQNLVKVAYEAAQHITDEKTRAQALLDVINEINYFTQHKN
jgi:hypothetical protein